MANKVKSEVSIEKAVRRSLAKFSTYWDNLDTEKVRLAEQITIDTEWVGGREKAALLLECSVATLDNYRSGKTQPSALISLKLSDAAKTHMTNLQLDKSNIFDLQRDDLTKKLALSREQLIEAMPAINVPDNIPVYGTAAGSISGSLAITDNIIDWVSRPFGLKNAQNAYALYVTGSSMQPRFWPGDIIFIHPDRPPRSGDIIVVQTLNHEGGDVISYVKEFIRKVDNGILAFQYNEPAEIEFKNNTIKAIHRVMTVNELLVV